MKCLNAYWKFLVVSVLCFCAVHDLIAESNVAEVFTPYTRVSVSPGSTVNYSLDIINHSDETINENITVTNIPRSWDYALSAAGLNVNRLAVLGKKKETLSLKIDVPYHVKKGYYTFYAKFGNLAALPLVINVSTAGSNETELSCEQKNMEGTAKSNFSFNAVLKNKTPSKQHYALMASPPKGWSVAIKPNSRQATSTELEANGTKTINYTIKAPSNVKAGVYEIPVKAESGSSSAKMVLEVVITGTYEMAFSSGTGLLSAKVTAGEEKKVELVISNRGSTKLENIELSATKPKNWEVSFDKSKIESLEAGKTVRVYAQIKADKKAIPGDYMSKITAKTAETHQDLSFRIMVKTPMLMGWIGVVIILISIGGVLYLIKKFGRR